MTVSVAVGAGREQEGSETSGKLSMATAQAVEQDVVVQSGGW